MLGDFAQDVPEHGAAWHGIIFRRSFPQLEELITRAKVIFPQWFNLTSDNWVATQKMYVWPNGATLKFRHAEDEDSWQDYQGHQYTWMGYDELPQWPTPNFYRQLKTRLRNGSKVIPNKRIRASGNPGGIGHAWIKDYFGIDRFPFGSVLIPKDLKGGERMFIRSRVSDNKILMKNDPEYIERLKGIGSEQLVKMYLDGDWNVIAGAFFPEFNVQRHVLAPFEVPSNWTRFRAADWGSAKPFCVLWFAVSDGTVTVPWPTPDDPNRNLTIPRGALVGYREWYGMKPGEPDVGLMLTANEFGQGIRERELTNEVGSSVNENGDRIDMSVIDPSAFKTDGGPSIAERIANEEKVYFQRADNTRKTGWDAVRARLKGEDFEGDLLPMIYFFTTCTETIRTVPALQHDRGKAAGAMEDVDTHSEDHPGDTVRYACMARPWVRKAPPPVTRIQYKGAITCQTTFADLLKQSTARRRENE